MSGDGDRPGCQVALCPHPAAWRTRDRDGRLVYVCIRHRPFAAAMARASIPDEVDEVES